MMTVHRRFWRDRSGNFAMMFAVLAVPIVTGVGAVTDYGYALAVKNQLQSSADAAAVSALAEQSVGVIAALKDGTTGEVDLGSKDAQLFFLANLNPKYAPYLKSSSLKVKRNGDLFTSEAVFAATVPTGFLAVLGVNEIKVSGVAQGSFVPATYVDFYLMLDNSPSMGLAATTADIDRLEANTSDTCAFACHIEDSTNDYYALAKSLGIALRVQLVRQAAQAMMDTAKATRKYSDQYRMAVYSMGASARKVELTEVASMSSNLDQVSDETALMDLMTIPYQGYNDDQQTDFDKILGELKKEVGKGGSGSTASDRQKVVFFVSDGVNDSYKGGGCKKKTTDKTDTGRCQQPLDFAECEKIKKNGARIAVLYTTYQPVPNNTWYKTWIKPFTGEINPAMKACATEGLFFEVSPSGGIEEAMNALFLKVVNLPKLTM
jgi:hypothetical protein